MVNGQPLSFDVTTVWRRNMIMRDRQTGTFWQHATGEALRGPLAGQRLEVLGGTQSTWAGWRDDYPESILSTAPDAPAGLMPKQVLSWMLKNIPSQAKTAGFTPLGQLLDAHAEVAGLTAAGAARAYPLDLLRREHQVNDSLGGQPFCLFFDPSSQQVRAFRRPEIVCGRPELYLTGSTLTTSDGACRWDRSGRPLQANQPELERVRVERQWWLGWVEFHPGTSVYRG